MTASLYFSWPQENFSAAGTFLSLLVLLAQTSYSPAYTTHIQKSTQNVACDSHLEAEIRVTSQAEENGNTTQDM